MGNKPCKPKAASRDGSSVDVVASHKPGNSSNSSRSSPNDRISPDSGHDTGAQIDGKSSANSLDPHASGGNMRRAGRDMEKIASYKALNDKALSDTKSRLERVQSHEDLKADFHAREVAAAALKAEMASDWLPEYRPVSIVPPERTPDTVLERVTRISTATIFKDVPTCRKVKVVCTMGPASWSEEGLAKLLDAGMNVARFNFSHGTHEAHQEVLDRLRKVVESKGSIIATLLDTKGPEIRTAMLKGGKDIELEAGQAITVYAAGEEYTSWEGYKDPTTGETKIGLSYGKLCSSVKPGNVILIADGAISIEVKEILSDKELRGVVINSHKLGQRKNCNLPGVLVDLPVLAPKDIEDVQKFACKNQMDFIAASFVQTAADVRLIRRVLDEAGGQHIQIISKIENEAGLRNIDDIIQETDGIMVARGDLAMEVPAEKIALAQKMIVAKCMLAGKFAITATQMLESMIDNPLPTRAEMTDVANAVFDGTDAVMLSGESANGKWPDTAVRTMASIVESAEMALDHSAQLDWVRVNSVARRAGPLTPLEATFASVAKTAVLLQMDTNGDGTIDATEGSVIVVFSRTGVAADFVSKYRPPCAVIVVSDAPHVLRRIAPRFGLLPCPLVDATLDARENTRSALAYAKNHGVPWTTRHVLVLSGSGTLWADEAPELSLAPQVTMERAASLKQQQSKLIPGYHSPFAASSITCLQTLRIGQDLIINKQFNVRGTKIIATLGPASWETPMLSLLLDRGVSIARINMSICKGLDHVKSIIAAWNGVVAEKVKPGGSSKLYTSRPALMCSIKGPEIRTTMLKDHKPLELAPGDKVTLVATLDPTHTGGRDAKGVITIGVTYPRLCSTVKKGSIILLADGTLKLEVEAVTGSKELVAKVLNAQKLGEAKLVDIPDAQIDLPFLGSQDKEWLTFCGKHADSVDFVTLPFVQSAEDVLQARKVVDHSGGPRIKLVSQIDNPAAVRNFDAILAVSDGIIVSRAHLGIRLPSKKVCLAQKWMITKANLKGVPIIVAAQMLESMVSVPRPTRAEMTDVANAAYDGADAILLRTETASGLFVDKVLTTAAAILRDAEVGIDTYAKYNFIRNFTPKPMPTLETLCSSAVKCAIDMGAALIALVCNTSAPIRALTKYRPAQVVVVCTTKPHVARQANLNHRTCPLLLPSTKMSLGQIRDRVIEFARKSGLAEFSANDRLGDQLTVLSGPSSGLFVTEEELAEMQLVTMVVGDESAALQAPRGYDGEDTIAYRSTKVGLDLVCDPIETPRKTKLLCTLGPSCWSEEGLAKLLDAGMNVARFNFSHGTHELHQGVLDRLRAVGVRKGAHIACLLDTKGPEIRTAMLRNHQPIELEAGQAITVVAVGDAYETFEGYKEPESGKTVIGLSYPHLCQDVKPGSRILLADGAVSIEVTAISSATELQGKVLNKKQLGERKNCNLPGVKVRLPVLTAHDIDDVQQFACKNQMDFVAASFVQSGDDVRFIRKTLDAAGGKLIRIISKIESAHGLQNFDDILRESDGIMVARGDLAMEIPSEKVALAQKMMITKANIAGKFIITATQMLESMVNNPLPTRAEMTDVANAVFDGTDAVMLSGETANGKFPDTAVKTMAAIVANAEVGINYYQVYDFIRDFTLKPMSTKEAVLGCAAKDAMDIDAGLIIVVTTNGHAARTVVKYRPPVPVLVITNNERVVRQLGPLFAAHAYLVDTIPYSREDVDFEIMLEKAAIWACEVGLCKPGQEVVVVHGCMESDAETMPMVSIKAAPGVRMPYVSQKETTKTLSLRTTAISLQDVLQYETPPRKTKVVCTMGPASWSEEGLAKLLDAGMNVARFNFSHGTHEAHQEVLDRLRKVAAGKKKRIATLLDTKGPEIRTAMLKGGQNLALEAGQEVTLVAVGDQYETWEGGKDDTTGETRIGISYAKLCSSVAPGKRILIADGALTVEVLAIPSATELRGRCLNACSLGQRKNCNLPGVKVDIPVLTPKDVQDLQAFAAGNRMDFVAASFVQTADDVRFIRKTLDVAGGHAIQIISKIENEAGLENFDDILRESDGIMVARGDLAMEIPSEKVALAQKMMITKANIAGKFIITATQMLESMVSSPLPTRAEMTDVANAVFDGTDAVMLSGETANGKFPDTAVKTMAAIVANAENASGYTATQCFIRDHSSKPFSMGEAMGAAVASTMVDCNAQLIIVLSEDGCAPGLVSKYRPAVPTLVVTPVEHVANQCNIVFGQHAVQVPTLDAPVDELVAVAKAAAQAHGLWGGAGVGIVLHGRDQAAADEVPVMRVVDLEALGNISALARRSELGGMTSRMFSLRV